MCILNKLIMKLSDHHHIKLDAEGMKEERERDRQEKE
jgi:hypothetical protein